MKRVIAAVLLIFACAILLTCSVDPGAIYELPVNPMIVALFVSGIDLTPDFHPEVTQYTMTASSSLDVTDVRPITADPFSSIAVNGKTVLSGQVSDPIDLPLGANTVTVVVTAGDGSTARTYTLSIYRLDGDATLSNLELIAPDSPIYYGPLFDPGNTLYLLMDYDGRFTVRPTVSSPLATVAVDGIPILSGSEVEVEKLDGEAAEITVTAEDGSTLTYTIAFTEL